MPPEEERIHFAGPSSGNDPGDRRPQIAFQPVIGSELHWRTHLHPGLTRSLPFRRLFPLLDPQAAYASAVLCAAPERSLISPAAQ